ncbi:unnamed protein product [Cyclocybe aegerita]|uniref:CBM1 domain-containing protein n=1 Tax=Cyclocybe aegerita TaxID=1973307 RepID=A0A8S0X6H7_CYCAE|nr:unnamed protein product [Cyclocybe aegerita]
MAGAVWCLLKSLYGLKQASLIWYQLLRKVLEALRFVHSEFDHALGEIGKAFGIKDLGPVTMFLGVQFKRDLQMHELWINQEAYTDMLLAEYGLTNCSPVSTPLDPIHPLGQESDVPLDIPDLCGGNGWTGATTCVSGYVCTVSNEWYSQCIPGTAPPAPSTTAPPTVPTPGSPSTTAPSGTRPPTGPPTLVSGWNFIRAVTSPNFHKYLQSEVYQTESDAVLGEGATAAQFQITNGQLVQNVAGGSLYATVEPRSSSSVMRLKVSWSKTPDTLGSFRFSGDTVEWSSPTISRPQTNAWLVCADSSGNRDVYINLGAYGYQTPSGCNDHTIHGFTGTTPD